MVVLRGSTAVAASRNNAARAAGSKITQVAATCNMLTRCEADACTVRTYADRYLLAWGNICAALRADH